MFRVLLYNGGSVNNNNRKSKQAENIPTKPFVSITTMIALAAAAAAAEKEGRLKRTIYV
jgi:hypothetical protein